MAGRQRLLEQHQAQKEFKFPVNLWDPTLPGYLPTQSAFFHDWDVRFRGYGGGLGNGKTTAGCLLAFYLSYVFPGNCGYIGRWDGKELVQTTMSEFFRLIPEKFFETHNKQMGYLKFKKAYGGSEIYYGDLKKEEWASSLNLGWFWFDQAEETDQKRWEHGVSRLRRITPLYANGKPLMRPDGKQATAPTYGFVTFNPDGTGSYLWKLFHPDSPDRQPDYKLYQATTYDGLAAGFVKQEYVDAMLAIFPEQARKRYLEGSWEYFEGKVFPQFDPKIHGVMPCRLDPAWSYYVSIDHGLSNPTSIGIWAVTPTGIKIRVREHYEGNGKPVSYHAACLKNLIADLPKKPALMVMDPACWAKSQSKGDHVFSVVDEYNACDVYPVPGNNDWNGGFNRINEALVVDPTLTNPVTGESGSPRLLAFHTCNNWLREMSNYKWKKSKGSVLRNAPDEPIDYNDHTIDETRYLLSLLPAVTTPQVEVQKKSPLEIVQEMRARYNPFAVPVHSGGSWMTV
jgi:hypothetical protein